MIILSYLFGSRFIAAMTPVFTFPTSFLCNVYNIAYTFELVHRGESEKNKFIFNEIPPTKKGCLNDFDHYIFGQEVELLILVALECKIE